MKINLVNEMKVSHVTASAQAARLELSDEERIEHVHGDRWIGYTRAKATLQRLEELYKFPSKQRMPNLLIIGPTNNGKSMIIEKFRRDHLWIAVRERSDHEEIPIVVVQTPSEPSVIRFYSMLVASLGAPIRPKARVAELEQVSLNLLRSVQAKILIIDELHNVLAGAIDVRREFLNLLRFLGNELRIPIVGVGIKDAYLAIRSDDQLENRFEPILLPVWEEGDELLSLLASFAKVLPLKRPSNIANEEMARYILSRTEGTIGEITKLLTAATVVAIRSGEESINQRTLGQANYQSPSERRRTFERALL